MLPAAPWWTMPPWPAHCATVVSRERPSTCSRSSRCLWGVRCGGWTIACWHRTTRIAAPALPNAYIKTRFATCSRDFAMGTPETAVLIRTFNEEKHLPRLLDALDAQTYRDFE